MPYGARELVARRIAEAYMPWRDRRTSESSSRRIQTSPCSPSSRSSRTVRPGRRCSVSGTCNTSSSRTTSGFFDRTFRPRMYPRSMERAVRIISVSDFTRRTLTARCDVPAGEDRRHPSRRGSAPIPAAHRPRPGLGRVEGPYLYCPAATWPHKGHGSAPSLLRGAPEEQCGRREARPHRVSGRRSGSARSFRSTRDLGIDLDVVHLGFVPFDEVRRLHAGAAAVVFPTTFEGFGLPVLEAIQAGER